MDQPNQSDDEYETMPPQLDDGTFLLPDHEIQRFKPRSWVFILMATFCVIGTILVILTIIFVLILHVYKGSQDISIDCANCTYNIVESIPTQVDLTMPNGTVATHEAFLELIKNANKSILIACYYMTFTNNAPREAGGNFGNDVFNAIIDAKQRNPNILIQIVQNKPTESMPGEDTEYLSKNNIAEVISVDWGKAFPNGILHSKLIITDSENFYVGSANMDWRSLTQVKELGIYVRNCKCAAKDMEKIFYNYYYLGKQLESSMEKFAGWPSDHHTRVNEKNRFAFEFNKDEQPENGTMFISSAPPMINAPERSNDLDVLLNAIKNATKFVYISVMDYLPLSVYSDQKYYWGEIENALRNASLRNVVVNMLVSKWNYTGDHVYPGLSSLEAFGKFCQFAKWCTGSINVRMMKIPDTVGYGPFDYTRVNHAKYVVTEELVYISTSNWSRDYFYTTGGISLISTHPIMRETVEQIFLRDWDSKYTFPVEHFMPKKA